MRKARLRAKLLSFLLALAMVVTALVPATVQAAGKVVTVGTQKELDAALADDEVTKIAIKAKKSKTLTIPEGDYSDIALVVEAANVKLNNYGTFKVVKIRDAKKYMEYATGNTIKVTDTKLTLGVEEGASVEALYLSKEDAEIWTVIRGEVKKLTASKSTALKLGVHGTLTTLNLQQPSKVNIYGESTETILCNTGITSEPIVLTSSVPIIIYAKDFVEVTFEPGAEGSYVVMRNEATEAKVTNNTTEDTKIVDMADDEYEIPIEVGETVDTREYVKEETSTPVIPYYPVVTPPTTPEEPEEPEVTPEPTYTVTFNNTSGSAIKVMTDIASGTAIAASEVPTVASGILSNFVGWYVNEEEITFPYIVTGDTVISAEMKITTATPAAVTINGIQYIYDGEDIALYLVPADYAGTTIDVVEGCTTIGSYAFYYNSNIETINLPSTVTTLNAQAFRGTSASTVNLNEGLTEIPYQAFRDAENLTSIEIPSTVTTIGEAAFRLSGLKQVILPASVSAISSSFRDCASLETVTIEGNTEIGNYAFRSCPKLTTVYLNGENPTFTGTSMAFSNYDTGQSDEITIYVMNETVEENVKKANGSCNGYTVSVVYSVDNEEALTTVLTDYASVRDGSSVTIKLTGESNIRLSSGGSSNANIKIVGTKDNVIDLTWGSYWDSATLSFEGVTIKGSTGYVTTNGTNYGSDYAALYSKNVTYTNCYFDGPFRLGRDGVTFTGCTFNNLGNDYVWTYGNDVTFTNCVFNSAGKAILMYKDGGEEISKLTVSGCTFNATAGATAWAIANQNCAAIEIDNSGCGVELIASGNTVDSNFSGEWRIKTYKDNGNTVSVNSTTYGSLAIDGKIMTIDANREVTVVE